MSFKIKDVWSSGKETSLKQHLPFRISFTITNIKNTLTFLRIYKNIVAYLKNKVSREKVEKSYKLIHFIAGILRPESTLEGQGNDSSRTLPAPQTPLHIRALTRVLIQYKKRMFPRFGVPAAYRYSAGLWLWPVVRPWWSVSWFTSMLFPVSASQTTNHLFYLYSLLP